MEKGTDKTEYETKSGYGLHHLKLSTQPSTDDRDNPVDGSPVFEITFNIPQAEYVGYDADRVAGLAVRKRLQIT